MTTLDVHALAAHIARLQEPSGRIPWLETGLWDPWNHSEAAMGLAVAGDIAAARRARDHLIDAQHSDGCWLADMGCAAPMDQANERLVVDDVNQVVDTNFCAYPAVFAWRLATLTGERADVTAAAAMVASSAEWLLPQAIDGLFPWRACEPEEDPHTIERLLTGNASIAMSLVCAARLLDANDQASDHIWDASKVLFSALRAELTQPQGRLTPKPRHAMDWYYPVLTGVLTDAQGRARFAAQWASFVHDTWGCRCVVDEPWATAAETAELAMACARVGLTDDAERLLIALALHADSAGILWMGRQFALDRPWPLDRPTWTAGAAILAADMVSTKTAAPMCLSAI